MRPLAIDENVNRKLVRGILRHATELTVYQPQQFNLLGASDPEILSWAAGLNAVLLSQDAATVPLFAYERVAAGLEMTGVIIIPQHLPLRQAVDETRCCMLCLTDEEWLNTTLHLPI
ncbi:MAG TPA: DUF5615 family PIN-like protein [Planctomycetota bacterium]|nr:DUF5615 family PIN-like protein [Planctomycetota bacterium]